jgi:carbamoylphosphate synthase small subunit
MYGGSAFPFDDFADQIVGVVHPDAMKTKDSMLVVWGGADINPQLYDHPQASRTWPGGNQDWIEWELMHRAVEMGIPIVGICRGAQMLCAKAGGFLIQHVDNHGGHHLVTTVNGEEIRVNSLHHQMMFAPPEVDHKLLAWCDTPRSPKYIYMDDKEFVPPKDWKEPEAIFFPKIKGLAIQWHPEMMDEDSEATQFVYDQMREQGWIA